VGALLAIRELLGDPTINPFPILCGTSAGAVNAATLACYANNFSAAVEALADVWRNMHAGQIYRADPAWHGDCRGPLAECLAAGLGDSGAVRVRCWTISRCASFSNSG
jgi:predicted acylesterase/phospholipase RssA